MSHFSHLYKNEKRLMPEDGKNSVIVFEFDEVKDEGVDDAERQSIFLVEKRLDEDAVGARVFHLRQLQQCGAGMRQGEKSDE